MSHPTNPPPSSARDQLASWDTLGPELGQGRYTVRMYGPGVDTAWKKLHEAVTDGPSPRAAADDMLGQHAALLSAQPRWKMTVHAGEDLIAECQANDAPVLVGTFSPAPPAVNGVTFHSLIAYTEAKHTASAEVHGVQPLMAGRRPFTPTRISVDYAWRTQLGDEGWRVASIQVSGPWADPDDPHYGAGSGFLMMPPKPAYAPRWALDFAQDNVPVSLLVGWW